MISRAKVCHCSPSYAQSRKIIKSSTNSTTAKEFDPSPDALGLFWTPKPALKAELQMSRLEDRDLNFWKTHEDDSPWLDNSSSCTNNPRAPWKSGRQVCTLPSAKEFWHHPPVMENKGLDFLHETAGLIRQLEQEQSKNTVVPNIFSILSQQTPKPHYSFG